MKKRKAFSKSFLQASALGLTAVFGWMILQGAIAVFPQIAGTTMIVIGIIGLSLLIYLGAKK